MAGEYLQNKFTRVYRRIIGEANIQCPTPLATEKERSKEKGQGKVSDRKIRLVARESLRFLTDFRLLFDNKQAERDLRNCKTKERSPVASDQKKVHRTLSICHLSSLQLKSME